MPTHHVNSGVTMRCNARTHTHFLHKEAFGAPDIFLSIGLFPSTVGTSLCHRRIGQRSPIREGAGPTAIVPWPRNLGGAYRSQFRRVLSAPLCAMRTKCILERIARALPVLRLRFAGRPPWLPTRKCCGRPPLCRRLRHKCKPVPINHQPIALACPFGFQHAVHVFGFRRKSIGNAKPCCGRPTPGWTLSVPHPA